jgi:hypothetical protein
VTQEEDALAQIRLARPVAARLKAVGKLRDALPVGADQNLQQDLIADWSQHDISYQLPPNDEEAAEWVAHAA